MHATANVNGEIAAVSERASREALGRVLNSSAFENSGRLRAFLSYIVQESLDGRAGQIAGKTIAGDVYGREPDDSGNSIVRVDAGRLRRKLAEYYDQEGKNDPVRILVDSGGYAPRFEIPAPDTTPRTVGADRTGTSEDAPGTAKPRPSGNRRGDLSALLIIGASLALGVMAWLAFFDNEPKASSFETSPATSDASVMRAALAGKSAATLQAANLAEKASELLFPIADADHQNLAGVMYREAIKIDPSFSGGYAGAAHSLGTLSVISPDPDKASEFLSEGLQLAEKAIDLDPLSGWAHSALAWVAFAGREYEQSLDLSRRAVALSPADGKVLDFGAAIALLTGNFEEAFALSDPGRPRDIDNRHPAYLNVHGVACYHLGRYARAIESFDAAVRMGGPVSELTLMYQAAATQAAGKGPAAGDLLDELRETWPAFRPELVANRFYQHTENVEKLLSDLKAAGLPAAP